MTIPTPRPLLAHQHHHLSTLLTSIYPPDLGPGPLPSSPSAQWDARQGRPGVLYAETGSGGWEEEWGGRRGREEMWGGGKGRRVITVSVSDGGRLGTDRAVLGKEGGGSSASFVARVAV